MCGGGKFVTNETDESAKQKRGQGWRILEDLPMISAIMGQGCFVLHLNMNSKYIKEME